MGRTKELLEQMHYENIEQMHYMDIERPYLTHFEDKEVLETEEGENDITYGLWYAQYKD